jgi:hypothetical protein
VADETVKTMSRWSDVKTNVFAFVVSLIDDSRRLAGSGSRSWNGVAEPADRRKEATSDSRSSIIIITVILIVFRKATMQPSCKRLCNSKKNPQGTKIQEVGRKPQNRKVDQANTNHPQSKPPQKENTRRLHHPHIPSSFHLQKLIQRNIPHRTQRQQLPNRHSLPIALPLLKNRLHNILKPQTRRASHRLEINGTSHRLPNPPPKRHRSRFTRRDGEEHFMP